MSTHSTDGARYATAIYGVLDAASSRLTLVNAGHPAALVLRTWSGARSTATGPALGLIEAGTFGSHSLTLTPGTVFVAYTDGVNEARNAADEEFGDDALADLVEQCRDDGARAHLRARARGRPRVSRRRNRIRTM